MLVGYVDSCELNIQIGMIVDFYQGYSTSSPISPWQIRYTVSQFPLKPYPRSDGPW
jgi:hypothetical protein